MHIMFITGTNTDIGKTIVTGLIARYLFNQSSSIVTQKWIQTGATQFSEDIQTHWTLMRCNPKPYETLLDDICPYQLNYPASAHLAAKLAEVDIDCEKIKQSYWKLKKQFDHVLVEGLGGLLVPINHHITTATLIKELNLPVIIVFSNELGAINHTLLTIDYCNHHKINILGLIANHPKKTTDELIKKDNPNIISTISNIPILASIPYIENLEAPLDQEPWFIELSNNLEKLYNTAYETR